MTKMEKEVNIRSDQRVESGEPQSPLRCALPLTKGGRAGAGGDTATFPMSFKDGNMRWAGKPVGF